MDVAVIWFRRDLRLQDNEVVARAAAGGKPCIFVFCLDPWFFKQPEIGWLRVRFLFESLAALDTVLRDSGNRLYILNGDSITQISRLMTELQLAKYTPTLYFNQDIQVEYGRQRDLAVIDDCRQRGIVVDTGHSFFLLHDESDMPHWWQQYYRYQYDAQYRLTRIPELTGALDRLIRQLPQIDPQHIANQLDLRLPTARQALFTGGEQAARRAVYSFLKDRVDGYHWKISRPYLAQRGATSLLGPHLAFGTISNRAVFQAAVNHRQKLKDIRPKRAFDIAAYLDRLRWRDSFTQRLWFHPELIWKNRHTEFDELYNQKPLDEQAVEHFERWKAGETGFPLLDAAMKQLKHDGFINFRMRAMAATFLTINCRVSWHHGARHFMNQLVDGDIAINHWQWQMQAGITNPLSPIFRMYSPTKNMRDRDSTAQYTHFWLPETRGQTVETILKNAQPMLDFTNTRQVNGKLIADCRKQVRARLLVQSAADPKDFNDISNRTIKYGKTMAYRYERNPESKSEPQSAKPDSV